MAYYRRNESDKAEEALTRALELADRSQTRSVYQAKLMTLRPAPQDAADR